jgi:hypothetical protein
MITVVARGRALPDKAVTAAGAVATHLRATRAEAGWVQLPLRRGGARAGVGS